MVAIMLLVSIQGWIIDDVVDEIKKDLGIYERVPVWERSEWPYITSGGYSYVMEIGDYDYDAETFNLGLGFGLKF